MSTTRDIKLERPQEVDIIQNITGAFGKYQLWLFILIGLSKIGVAFHQMAIIFLAPKVSYSCDDLGNMTCPCPNPEYDRSLFQNTIVMEWDLICDKKWLANFSQTIFQLGTLLGSVFFGMAGDRFGRKNPLLVAVVTEVSIGILCAFLPNYWAFTLFRLIVAIAIGGVMVTTFVILMEFVGTQYRDVISALYHVPFNLGHMLLPVFGYFLRKWNHIQLALSLSTSVTLLYFFFVPETPRWLIAVNRSDEAIKILEHVAKINNKPTENIRSEVETFQAAAKRHHLKKGTILDLFRTPNIRKNILIMSFIWLDCSYCFYGVSQYVGQLSGDIFRNVEVSAFVTLLGTLVSIPLMKMMGRRTIVIIFNFVCAFCLFVLAFLPEGIGKIIFASVGVVSSFIVFVLVYLYCSEMFPTVVRNAAIGFSSMMARVGSMIAPFVVGSGDTAKWLPPLIFAIVPFIGGFLTFFLPETKNCVLMTTVEEGENFGKMIRHSSKSLVKIKHKK